MPAAHASTHAAGGTDAVTPLAIGAVPVSLTVTGYTGGGATNLDGVATVALAVPEVFSFLHATLGYQLYRLRAGTDAQNVPGIIRPLDYNASTNAKVWEKEL